MRASARAYYTLTCILTAALLLLLWRNCDMNFFTFLFHSIHWFHSENSFNHCTKFAKVIIWTEILIIFHFVLLIVQVKSLSYLTFSLVWYMRASARTPYTLPCHTYSCKNSHFYEETALWNSLHFIFVKLLILFIIKLYSLHQICRKGWHWTGILGIFQFVLLIIKFHCPS